VLVKAGFRAVDSRGSIDEGALVSASVSFTTLDRRVADGTGVKHVGRRVRAVVADGHEVEDELAIVDKLLLKARATYVYLVVFNFLSSGLERSSERRA